MEEQSMLKKILTYIKKFFLIIFLFIGNIIKALFGIPKEEKNNIKNKYIPQDNSKKAIKYNQDETTLPDEDNIKSNPHNNNNNSNDTKTDTSSQKILLELPKKKLYKYYNKDNELKYLTIEDLLDLIIKEELERIYKVEHFKLKTATNSELKKVNLIKENILPNIIIRVEKGSLYNSEMIKKEVTIKLEEELEKNPLFPPRTKSIQNESQEKKEIYTLAFPKQKNLIIEENKKTKITNNSTLLQTPKDNQEIIKEKLDSTNVRMVQTTKNIPKPTIKDNIKDAAVISAVATAGLITDIISPSKENKSKEEPKKDINKKDLEILEQEKIEILKETQLKSKDEIKIIETEIKNINSQNKEDLEKLKQEIEQKIDKIKNEQEKKEEIKQTDDYHQTKEINDVTEVSENIISESKKELSKDDFFDKDYERIERQIDKMLEDITYTYLRYDGKLSEKQKRKLKIEENKLRQAKDNIQTQKHRDILNEQNYLNEEIKKSEKEGLENELLKIQKENEQEVSNNLLNKMQKLEGMTAEQVANTDKKIMLKRLNKSNKVLEFSSILALPFIRNKYFFYLATGLIVNSHFNFINAFFSRKTSNYEPADLINIQKGQDALNGALDITYKNLVELEYLEQRALSKYPELAYDPSFINQVTRLRTNLNKKYNKLMTRNKTLEKYRIKTKKQIKILKKDSNKSQNYPY